MAAPKPADRSLNGTVKPSSTSLMDDFLDSLMGRLMLHFLFICVIVALFVAVLKVFAFVLNVLSVLF